MTSGRPPGHDGAAVAVAVFRWCFSGRRAVWVRPGFKLTTGWVVRSRGGNRVVHNGSRRSDSGGGNLNEDARPPQRR
ncbi:hypothetical protein Hdeb2414_s0016g00496001 [Helianthus debilis subsp. tardiflorus]